MERIKRFLKDEAGSSEAVSSVVLIAFAALLLSAALAIYYGAFTGFFQRMATWLGGAGTTLPPWTAGS
jgi:Flp pilus assembly pilin Flp